MLQPLTAYVHAARSAPAAEAAPLPSDFEPLTADELALFVCGHLDVLARLTAGLHGTVDDFLAQGVVGRAPPVPAPHASLRGPSSACVRLWSPHPFHPDRLRLATSSIEHRYAGADPSRPLVVLTRFDDGARAPEQERLRTVLARQAVWTETDFTRSHFGNRHPNADSSNYMAANFISWARGALHARRLPYHDFDRWPIGHHAILSRHTPSRHTSQLIANISGRRLILPTGDTVYPELMIGTEEWTLRLDPQNVIGSLFQASRTHVPEGSTRMMMIGARATGQIARALGLEAPRLGPRSQVPASPLGRWLATRFDCRTALQNDDSLEIVTPDRWGVVLADPLWAACPPARLAAHLEELYAAQQAVLPPEARRPGIGRITVVDSAIAAMPVATRLALPGHFGVPLDLRHPTHRDTFHPQRRLP